MVTNEELQAAWASSEAEYVVLLRLVPPTHLPLSSFQIANIYRPNFNLKQVNRFVITRIVGSDDPSHALKKGLSSSNQIHLPHLVGNVTFLLHEILSASRLKKYVSQREVQAVVEFRDAIARVTGMNRDNALDTSEVLPS